MIRKCRICGTRFEVNHKNFYPSKKTASGFRSECKKCSHSKVEQSGYSKDNPFVILHEWLELVFRVPRSNYEGQMAIIGAIGGVLGRGF
jgi:hypothetical protein